MEAEGSLLWAHETTTEPVESSQHPDTLWLIISGSRPPRVLRECFLCRVPNPPPRRYTKLPDETMRAQFLLTEGGLQPPQKYILP